MAKKMNTNSYVNIILVIVIIVAAYFVFLFPTLGEVNSNRHNAVFLSNGQVYFAKVTENRGDFLKLEDIYYLRVQRTLQPQPEGQPPQQAGVQLVKLGSELHGPEDIMLVNKEHVLFTEPLKAESAVVAAIDQEKQNRANNANEGAVTPPATEAQPTTPAPTPTEDTTPPATEEVPPAETPAE